MFLNKIKDCFKKNIIKEPLLVKHQIKLLPNSEEIQLKTYQNSRTEKNEIDKQIKELLEKIYIRESNSSYA